MKKPTNSTGEQFLKTRDVRRLLNVTTPTLLGLVATGRLPAVVVNAGPRKRTLRFRPTDLEQFIADNLTGKAA